MINTLNTDIDLTTICSLMSYGHYNVTSQNAAYLQYQNGVYNWAHTHEIVGGTIFLKKKSAYNRGPRSIEALSIEV